MNVLGDKDDFDPVFNALDKKSAIFKDVQGVIDNLKNDVIPGERIKYKQIPEYYKKRHDIDNAFRVHLPQGMRLIYSITNYKGEKTALLMQLFPNHKAYARIFKYKS